MTQQTNPTEAAATLETEADAVYLDVRTVGEFEAGHPTGAYNVPIVFLDPATRQPRPNPDFARVVKTAFGTDRKLLVGCQAGGRSQKAAEVLESAGFADVTNVQGGFGGGRDDDGVPVVGWKDAGLAVEPGDGAERGWAALQSKAEG